MPTNKWICLSLLLLTGCSGSKKPAESADADGSLSVVATVGMVADLVKQVGGDRIQVTQIMGSGVDPHLYKANRDDVQTIMSGDIVFYSGLMLEGKMADTLIKVARKKPVIAVTEQVDEANLLEPEDFAGHFDPHLWMDVAAWSNCVDVITEVLAEQAPQHADFFRANATAYKTDLEALHQYGLDSIGSIPEERRILITSHDAFNYFGRAYGLEVQGVQGLSTESEAGLQRINELVDLLVEKKISAVFVESSVPSKNIEALVEGARSKGHDVVVGGELFSDAMGETGTYRGSYIGMLDHNITLVARGLGGQAPEKGMQEKL
ncbi:MAG: zinc ABC transporter substrate-binding protein [Rubripirellula sp.]|nr:zinc ABC transporter substrate-binding protein [Rubripirellula sp.]